MRALAARLDWPFGRCPGRAASTGLDPGEKAVSEARGTESDRRKFRRTVIGIPVQAVLGDAVPGDPRRIVGLRVLNVSRGGVSATSQEPLAPSQTLTLFFPPVGSGKGRDTRGQVVRCDHLGDHYSVGISFEDPWPDPDEISAKSHRFS